MKTTESEKLEFRTRSASTAPRPCRNPRCQGRVPSSLVQHKVVYLILSLSWILPVTCFVIRLEQFQTVEYGQKRRSVARRVDLTADARAEEEYQSLPVDSTISNAATDYFHQDMLRLLSSRRGVNSTQGLPLSPWERRSRPELINNDFDGAERVATMLQHMVQIGVATEQSYQIVLKAFRDRGRLRWRQSDSRVVCSADVVPTLLEELWDLTNGNVSVESCNLALESYAICATPRGERYFAHQAQEFITTLKGTFEGSVALSPEFQRSYIF